jgi:transcriptional regulator with XRE-family HTH domain
MPTAVLESVPIDTAKIKALREKLGLSQEQAAQRAKIGARQAWNHIEVGRRSDLRVSQLERIAAVLGVKARDLLK